MDTPFPSRILALAEQAGGVPLAFREDDKVIVIVLMDGRKLTFEKEPPTVSGGFVIRPDSPPQKPDTPNGSQEILTPGPGHQDTPRNAGKTKRKEKKADG
jgi:hypothetical protein